MTGASTNQDSRGVAVLVDTSTGWGRRLIRGVTNYARKHGPWHLWVEPRGRSEHMQLPPGWHGDGVIARITNQKMSDMLDRLSVPVINVSGIELPKEHFPRVATDYTSVAKFAAEHLIDRGYQRFGYVGPMRHSYVKKHHKAFLNEIEKIGASCEVFNHRFDSLSSKGWESQHEMLGDWVEGLEKPIGILGWATTPGLDVLDVCRYRGIICPDQVAVLAGDDDQLLCDTTNPSLSGVLVSSEQIGYQAALRLDQLFAGKKVESEPVLIDPIEITTRGSTETLAIEDKELFKAVIFLRQNAYQQIAVEHVADAVPMSRRALERKFKDKFQRTVLDEIQRLRIARAKELLAKTDMSIDQVAESVGYGTPEYLATLFRKKLSTTPLKYRSLVRGR